MQSKSQNKSSHGSSGPLAAGVAAAAVTAGMAAAQAQGGVVYTPFSATVNAANPSASIDFTGDGTADASIEYSATAGLTLNKNGDEFLYVVANSTDNTVAALPYGETIDGTAPAGDDISKLGVDPVIPSDATSITINDGVDTPDGGFTSAAGLQYIGLQVDGEVNGTATDYYAWIGLDITNDSSLADLSAQVEGFAFESSGVPNSIDAGEVPEPTSLALLAMGVVGLGMYRRRGGCAHL